MNVLLFFLIISVLLEAFSRISFRLGVRQGIECLLASFTLFWAWVIVASSMLSLIHLLTAEAFGVMVIATVLIIFESTPRPPALFYSQISDLVKKGIAYVRVSLVHGILLGLVVLWFCWAMFKILLLPPMNFDSLTYHLPMIANWIQHGYVGGYETTTLRQIISPANAEILQMFHVIFVGKDILVRLVQFEAFAVCFLSVYCIARLCSLSIGWALNASLSLLSIPLLLLQSFTTQNDIVAAAGICLCLVWVSSYIVEPRSPMVFLLAVGLGILIGVKFHMLIAVPILVALTLVVFWFRRKSGCQTKHVIIFVVGVIVSVSVLGSQVYIRNLQSFGTLIPPVGPIATHFKIGVSTLLQNARYFGKWWLVTCWDFVSETTWSEDVSHFGPLFGYCILPFSLAGGILSLVKSFQKKENHPAFLIMSVLVLAGYGTLAGFGLSHQPRPYDLRYLLFVPVIMSVVSTWLLSRWVPKLEKVFAWLLLLVCFTTAILTAVNGNPVKLGDVIPLDPWQRTTSQFTYGGQDAELFKKIDESARSDESILFSGFEDDWSYTLFGRDFSRHVYYAPSFDRMLWYLGNYPISWIVIRHSFENEQLVKYLREQPSRFHLAYKSPDTTNNYFHRDLLLFKTVQPLWDPTWYDGIYGDNMSSGDFSVGSEVPGKVVLRFLVDPIFNGALSMKIENAGELPREIHLPEAGLHVLEFQLHQKGAIRFHLNQTYVPKELGFNDDTRKLGVVIKSIEFEFNPEATSTTIVQVFP